MKGVEKPRTPRRELLVAGRAPALVTVVAVHDAVSKSFTYPVHVDRLKHPSVERAFTSIV